MTKKELKEIYDINKEIMMWQNELNKLECKSLIGGQKISDMPRGGGLSDKVADLAIEMADIKLIIQGKLTEIQIQRKKILAFIGDVDDSIVRQIIYLYCVSNLSFKQVAKTLGEGYTEAGVKQAYYRYLKKHNIN